MSPPMTDTAELKPAAWRWTTWPHTDIDGDEWAWTLTDVKSTIPSYAKVEPLYSADALSSLVRERDELLAKWTDADEDAKVQKEFLAVADNLAKAAEADAARMREALEAGGGTAVTEDGVVLTIQISGSTLANAIKHMPKAEIFDEGLQDFFHPEIVDEVAFLKEMAGALRCEEEDGTTLVHRMLDEAAIHIMHVGGDGVLSAQEVRDRARNALGGKDE